MTALEQLQVQLLPRIEQHLEHFLTDIDFGLSAQMGQMLTYHMGWGPSDSETPARGKRIRPFLTLLCAGACEGDPEKALPGAAAVELLHNFTLIHDDIEDSSPLRHGQPTLWKQWGTAQAINAGDALFSIAQTSMLALRVTCGEAIALQAAEWFNAVCLHLTRGQFLDISFETSPEVPLATYLDMIEGKTAALIAFAAALGGLTSGQDFPTQNLLAEFGKRLGLAFQIQDDYLGIWGDPAVTGKSAASDLLTKKKSLPVLFGLAHCPEFRILWAGEQPSSKAIAQMSTLLEACGAQAYTAEQAHRHTTQAYQTLETLFPARNLYANALHELTGKLLNRPA